MAQPNRFVAKISPYPLVPSIEKISKLGQKGVFKLDRNESTVPPSKKLLKALSSFLLKDPSLNWYPDPFARKLRKLIAKKTGAKPEQVLLTNGSNSAHELICNVFLEENDEVIVPVPTYENFLVWPHSRGAKIVEVPLGLGEKADAQKIIQKISSRTKIIYLINPFVSIFETKDIEKIARAARHAVVIVDEAYFEFFGKSAVQLIKRHGNIFVTRSFSKALSLAGVRLGCVLSQEKNTESLSRLHDFKSVNVLAQVAGFHALKDSSFVKNHVLQVNKSISLLAKALPRLGFDVMPTRAGFVLFRHKKTSTQKVQAALERQNVFVRASGKKSPLAGWLKMSVGTLKQTKELLKRFEAAFGKSA